MKEEGGRLQQTRPVWDRDDFVRFLNTVAPLVSFLTDGESIRKPDFVIRYESIQEDFSAFTGALGLPETQLPHVNRSAAPAELTRSVLADEEIRSLVCGRFAADMDFFNYGRASPR
jgi:hypothetical protein